MPTFLSPHSDRIRIADEQAGGNLGERIANAFALLGTGPGEVWVFEDGLIENSLTVGPTQVLRLFPGTRTINNGIINLHRQSAVIGPGPVLSTFVVPSSRAEGVFRAIGGEPGPRLEGFRIAFDQPDVAGGFIEHGPALRAENTPRTQVANLKIERAWVGFEMTGNSGGSRLESIDMSAFRFGVNLDGSIDSVRIRDLHFWPFGLSPTQAPAFFDGETYGIRVGRVDDLHVDGYLNIAHCGLLVEGQTFGHVVNSNFDSKMGIHMNAGSLQVSGCHFSSLGPPWIVHLGGQLVLSACAFFGRVAMPGVIARGKNDSSLVISSSTFNTGFADVSTLESRGDNVIVTSNYFLRDPNLDYTEPTVRIIEGRVTFIGNRTRDKGTGTGVFLQVDELNDWHRIAENADLGWATQLP